MRPISCPYGMEVRSQPAGNVASGLRGQFIWMKKESALLAQMALISHVVIRSLDGRTENINSSHHFLLTYSIINFILYYRRLKR